MSDENATTSETNGATNGASNGMPNGDPNGDPKTIEAVVDAQHREDETVPHKKRSRGRRDRTVAATPAVTPPVAAASAVMPPVEEPAASTPAAQESEPPAAAPQESAVTTQEVIGAPPAAEDIEAPSTQESPHPHPAPASESLRLRMKVWTDRWTGKRYLMPVAIMRDLDKNGRPISDVMLAYAVCEDDTRVRVVTLRAAEWQALPFSYFQEDGLASRAPEHTADVIAR